MANKEYMDAKFKHFTSWKEAVYADEPVVLVWCDNYRQQKTLMNELYHLICDGHRDRCDIIHHANSIKFKHINKKFVFAHEVIRFMGYNGRTSVYIDMRHRGKF